MPASPHALSWFEIPVTNFPRAKAFYESVLGVTIEPMVMGPTTMGFLSSDPNAVGGAIVHGEENFTPSKQGTIVYLNGGDDLAPMLARVEGAGGSIAVPKTDIGNDFGHFAHFIDTEGNKVGLHSMG
jgi:predicted enzyme related to lactoylglutathione lyase